MDIVNIREFEESFVIHFGSPLKRINAYTLASTLVAVSDAVKDANAIINPGYEVEVLVEAIGEGSFRAKIKTAYKGLNNIFSNESAKAIVLGVIASFVYQHTIAPDSQINIKVDDAYVVIEQDDKKIIIPKEVHECVEKVEKSRKFKDDVGRVFLSVESDEDIESFGITGNLNDKLPAIEIPRSRFTLLANQDEEQTNEREISEVATLQILRAILENSKRRWEFVWRGIKISGPVLDDKFYSDFFDHKITIAPGDALEVKMKIYQQKDKNTGIFTNKRYEVIEVMKHIPKPRQQSFEVANK